jgi:hypothetical protein
VIAPLQMEERFLPSRPLRLGTRRRARSKRAGSSAEGGLAPAKRAASLDTEKYLATTVADWLQSTETEEDTRRRNVILHHRLNNTVHRIWQSHRARLEDYEPGTKVFEDQFKLAARWEKQWQQLHNCQSEWIGYRAECCGGSTRPVAVPIGCNHRLCPLCSWNRSSRARKKIKKMFDRLTHPVLITLTIPNLPKIRKHDYTLFRQRVRAFIKQHNAWIQGGVYSLETTYNRAERSWHIHVHILADVSYPLPTKNDKIKIAGRNMMRFTVLKRRLEYDWLRLWKPSMGKKVRTDANAQRRAGEEYQFEQWLAMTEAHRVREFRPGLGWQPIEGLSKKALQARREWNREFRRTVDIRPVMDRDGAAREVLKYITKSADFCDLPEAVEPFVNAVKGARLIQTFGSWYGVKLDDEKDDGELRDWGELRCNCGENHWLRMGVFYHSDVEMDGEGRWRLRSPIDHNSRGTVPRPTIRALEAREE